MEIRRLICQRINELESALADSNCPRPLRQRFEWEISDLRMALSLIGD